MKKPSIIQYLIGHYNEYKYTKPKFRVGDLFVCEIVLMGNRNNNTLNSKGYLMIKPFAVIAKDKSGEYFHLKSGLGLEEENSCKIGDYVALNIKPFNQHFEKELAEENYTDNTKLSAYFIDTLEMSANYAINPCQKTNTLFEL